MAEEPGSPNRVLADRYRIEREIGRGGMAVVYLATDMKLDAAVAVKVLDRELAASLGTERFNREIRITAGLRHPNILSVFDSGEIDGVPFCVMPYVEGETLDARIQREGPLPIDEACTIAREVADGLAYAHGQGFVHRDVKPANILLSHGHAWLADFGIARAIDAAAHDRLTTTGLTVGTASYMSPEQAGGEAVDGRSDIYSLGCVLYEMLAGAPPFAGPSARAILARHLADTVPELRTVRETVPPALESAIRRAMAKLPADRFQDAAELGQALAAGETSGAHPVPGRRRFGARRLAAAAVLVLAAAAVLWRVALGPGESLDPNRIVVFPLVVSEGFAGPLSVGEDVATMIGNALDGAGDLRWIDGWSRLDPRLRERIRDLTDGEAREIARATRSAYYVTGRISALGDSAAVSLVLNDARGAADPVRAQAVAPADEAWKGVRAVNRLLPQLIPTGAADDVLAEWERRPPLAIASFLLGEAAFRRVHLAEALQHYRSAVEADSSFAIAALRGAQAASWAHSPDQAGSLVRAALRQPLPPRYAAFARGYQAYLDGRADSALAALRRALDLDDRMAVAWLQVGETWTHLLPEAGAPDDSALAAFDAVVRLDPGATNALFHLIQILLRRGDVERAGPLLDRFVASGPEGAYADQLQIVFDCVRDGPENVPWDEIATSRPFPLFAAANQLSGGGSQMDCARAAYSALVRNDTTTAPEAVNRRFFNMLGLHTALLSQGREDDARAQLDAFVERWDMGASLFLLTAPVYDGFVGRAREIARADSQRYGPAWRGLQFSNRLWELGMLEARRGDAAVAAAVAADLRRRADGIPSAHEGLLGRSLEAHIALAAGDTAGAFEGFRSLVPAIAPGDALAYDEVEPLAAERLEYARLLLARGEHRRAIEVADVLDSPWPRVHALYLVPSLELRIRAAAAAGDGYLGSRYRDRLEALQAGQQ
jgi:tetratricopeptide (TPR) repeat protein